jgi:hypothetical protein
MDAKPKNAIERAMAHLGGSSDNPDGRPEHLAAVCNCSADAVRVWLKAGSVNKAKHAFMLARALLANGTPIAIEELCGEKPLVTNGDGGNGGRKPSKGGRPMRSTTAWSTASVADRSGESAHVTPRVVARLVGTRTG